jgi:hypothetical protein
VVQRYRRSEDPASTAACSLSSSRARGPRRASATISRTHRRLDAFQFMLALTEAEVLGCDERFAVVHLLAQR